jgi:Tol biopolymer transport system component/predicted Ser/Thr protein kinase
MSLSAGDRLGPYEIVAPIGKGGMGEVYRALDPRVGREVAIKVSAEEFSERFEREARAIAALNHPNICQLYDVGPNYLVMELVEGVEPKGPLPLEEALPIAKQIVDALAEAHEKGVVHRDLKPGNIKMKADGTVKVLDFGLATVAQPSTTVPDPANSPTLTMAATQAGMILGTAGYMSPEQARGKQVDKRADIWAFGVVLYEMLTGKRLFQGDDITDTLAAVLRHEPDWEQVPAKVRRLLRRCLAKDPAKRLRDIGDVWELLEEVPQVVAAGGRAMAWKIAAGALAIVALGVSFIHFREKPPETPLLRATILPPENATADYINGLGLPALSPDGKRIVFGARSADGKAPLWVRSLDALTAQPLAGTDGAIFPFWSPDSRFIAFFADGKLKKIDATGGPALTLADAPLGRGGSWSREGVIVFQPANTAGPLVRVSSAGGASSPLKTAQGRLPWFLPDGQHFLYQVLGANPAIRVGSLDGGETKMVMEAGSNALYAQGHILFLRDGTLMAQVFDPKRLVTTGEAVPVAEQIQTVLNSGTVGVFSVSETGMLAYRSGIAFGGLQLTWFDRNGEQGAAVGEPANVVAFQFSPDRKSIAAEIQDRTNLDIWTYDVSRGLRTRLTFDPSTDINPVWSPDGRSIVFTSNRKGHYDLYRKSANGGGAEELLYADNLDKHPTSCSADGKSLLYFTGGNPDLWVLPLTGGAKPFPFLQTAFVEVDGQFSPDGHWIAYQSNESQRFEIYIASFPGPGGKRQISTAGGTIPRWRQDGKEIFYMGPDRRLMAAEVTTQGGTLEAGQVRPLFGAANMTQGVPFYDVSADGQHFLLRTFPEQKAGEPLTLVQNWTAALKK